MSGWDPQQYHQFAEQRRQPFFDLLGLVQGRGQATVYDLGCGSGELTRIVHDTLGAESTTGIDNSDEMLRAAAEHAGGGVTFASGDLAAWHASDTDLVFANAALHWVPDHAAVLARWTQALRPGGELAVQVPANADHPSHTVSRAVGAAMLGDAVPPDPVEANVLDPAAYAGILYDLGFTEQHVRLQVYGHVLASTKDVVEWVKGTSLTRFKRVMEPAQYDEFLKRYTAELLRVLGDHAPYFYAFKRILIWGRRGEACA